MILSLLNGILKFLHVIAPYVVSIMVGQMMADNILAVLRWWGDKHEQGR